MKKCFVVVADQQTGVSSWDLRCFCLWGRGSSGKAGVRKTLVVEMLVEGVVVYHGPFIVKFESSEVHVPILYAFNYRSLAYIVTASPLAAAFRE